MKAGALLGCCALLSSGCIHGPEQSGGNKDRYVDAERFKASAAPYSKASLILAGTTVPVDLTRKVEGKVVAFQLSAHGQAIEVERYESDSAGIRILTAGGETYSPPIPLLRFPFDIRDEWHWKGMAAYGSVEHPAEARVSLSKEVLNVPGGPLDAVRVSAVLKFRGNGLDPATRTLDFWFVPGKGIVKRQFGSSSTREPADPMNLP